MKTRSLLRALTIAAVIVVLVVGVLAAVIGLWLAGYISRPVASALSPDGRLEAVCRGRLPESTEYDLWLRRPRAVFGRRLGQVGT